MEPSLTDFETCSILKEKEFISEKDFHNGIIYILVAKFKGTTKIGRDPEISKNVSH